MEFHDVANIFPMMSDDDFNSLVDDIAENGQIEPIWVHDDKIIDGRNRYKACKELGLMPDYREWVGEGSLVSFVVSLNLTRRHLTAGQKATVGVDMLPELEKEAKKRQIRKPVDSVREIFPEQNIIEEPQDRPRAIAAKAVGVNNRYIQDAKKIKEEAPELFEEVRSGAMSIPEAKRELDSNGKPQPHVSHNSGNNEWYTPSDIIEAARRVMGNIDLDPASSETANENVRALHIFTEETNGLDKEWAGNVWMNPPYASDLVGKFAEKIASSYEDYDITSGIVLVNNATETAWFKRIIDVASHICFPSSRVKFWKPTGDTGQPLQGQAILYMGKNGDSFVREFSDIGFVVEVCSE